MKITIDTERILHRIAQWLDCLIAHDWDYKQEVFVVEDVETRRTKPVIAWKVCRRCAKSKLIHILH